ncbi:MAG: hypothetical protein ABJC66_04190 [Gammaproteobacteria bacterium]
MNKLRKVQLLKRAKARLKAAAVKPHVKADRHFVTALARGLEVLACFGHGEKDRASPDAATG